MAEYLTIFFMCNATKSEIGGGNMLLGKYIGTRIARKGKIIRDNILTR
jgi:hypothetical protein